MAFGSSTWLLQVNLAITVTGQVHLQGVVSRIATLVGDSGNTSSPSAFQQALQQDLTSRGVHVQLAGVQAQALQVNAPWPGSTPTDTATAQNSPDTSKGSSVSGTNRDGTSASPAWILPVIIVVVMVLLTTCVLAAVCFIIKHQSPKKKLGAVADVSALGLKNANSGIARHPSSTSLEVLAPTSSPHRFDAVPTSPSKEAWLCDRADEQASESTRAGTPATDDGCRPASASRATAASPTHIVRANSALSGNQAATSSTSGGRSAWSESPSAAITSPLRASGAAQSRMAEQPDDSVEISSVGPSYHQEPRPAPPRTRPAPARVQTPAGEALTPPPRVRR